MPANKSQVRFLITCLALAWGFFATVGQANAQWSGPTQEPPLGNPSPFVSTDATSQTKTGTLTIGANFYVNGSSAILGSLGLNATPTSTVRLLVAPIGNSSIDAGTGAVRSSYTALADNDLVNKVYLNASLSTLNYWIKSGSNLYSTSTITNVGIGTNSPNSNLEVVTSTNPTISISSTGGATSNHLNFRANSHSQPVQAQIKTVDNGDFSADLVFSNKLATSGGALTERMRIKSNGNVGIGTTAPLGAKLHIYGGDENTLKLDASSGEPAIFYTQAGSNKWEQRVGSNFDLYSYTNSSWVFSILGASGNVGIGTTSPWQKLTVEGAIATKPSGVDGYYSYLRSNWSSDNAFELGISDKINNHKLITSSNYHFGSILQFWSSDSERMRIDGTGNVGIGTTNPGTYRLNVNGNLNVSGSANFTGQVTVPTPTATSSAVNKSYVDGIALTAQNALWNLNGSSLRPSSTAWNVIVGATSTPSAKLHVAGSFQADGVVVFNNTLYKNGGNRLIMVDNAGNLSATTTSAATGLPVTATTGQTLRHDGTSWVANSLLYNNGTNIGIGTTDPTSKLHALDGTVAELKFNSGLASLTPALAVGNTGSGGKFAALVAGTVGSAFYFDDSGRFDIVSTPKTDYTNNTLGGGSAKLSILSSGNVGVASTSPVAQLGVGGTGYFTGTVSVATPTADSHAVNRGYLTSALSAFNTSTNLWKLSGNNLYASSTDWNVGIGKTNPGVKLDVNGQGRFIGGLAGSPALKIGSGTGGIMSSGTNDIALVSNAINVATFVAASATDVRFQINTTNYSTMFGQYEGNWSGLNNPMIMQPLFPATSHDIAITGVQNSPISGIVVKASGEVGVGSTSPAAKLGVEGTGYFTGTVSVAAPTADGHAVNKGYLTSALSAFNTSTNLWKYSNGNIYPSSTAWKVGVGTANPIGKVHILGSDGIGSNASLRISNPTPDDLTSVNSIIFTHRQDTADNTTAAAAGRGGRIVSGRDGVYGGAWESNHNSNLQFYTALGGQDVERLRINSSGNVGIGTSSPGAKLSISDDTNYQIKLNSFSSTAIIGIANAGPLLLSRTGGASDFVITNTGNVGVASTSPVAQLGVGGTGYFSGTVSVAAPTADGHAVNKGYLTSALSAFNTSTNLWKLSGNNVYASSTDWNVGVGIANPTAKLQVGTQAYGSAPDAQQFQVGLDNYSGLGPVAGVSGYPIAANKDSYNSSILDVVGGWEQANATHPLLRVSAYNTIATTPALVVLNSGKVGIGMTNPAWALDINRAGNAASIHIQKTDATTASWYLHSGRLNTGEFSIADDSAYRFTIANGGNVGIASTSPVAQLGVGGTGYFTGTVSVATPTANSHAATKAYVDDSFTAYNNSSNYWKLSGNNLYASSTAWNVGVGVTAPGTYDGVVSKIEAKGTGITGITINSAASSTASLVLAENNDSMWHLLSRGDQSNRFELYAADGTSDGAKLTVLQGGNTGIGTVSPNEKLSLYTASAAQTAIKFGNSTTGDAATDGLTAGIESNGSAFLWQRENNYLRFGTNNTERMRIAVNGKVGIGTVSPAGRLDLGASVGGGNGLRIGDYLELNERENFNNGSTIGFNAYIDPTNINNFKPTYAVGSGMVLAEAGGGSGNLDFFGINWNNATSSPLTSFNHVMRLSVDGKIGIRTDNPTSSLDVYGGNVLINDAVITSSTPKAAINKEYLDSALSVFNTNTNLWKLSGNNVYASSTAWNVGIGTNSPYMGKLHINALGASTTLTAIPTADQVNIAYGYNGANSWIFREAYASSNWGLFHNNDVNTFDFVGGSVSRLHINLGSGSIGVGTTNPGTYKLAVNGSVSFDSGNIVTDGIGNMIFDSFVDKSNGIYKVDPSATTTNSINVAGTINSVGGVLTTSGTGNNYMAGNLGLGVTSPAAKLQVNGGMVFKRTVVGDTDYTALATDYIIAFTSLSAQRTLNLPNSLCNAANAGRVFIVVNETNSNYSVSIDPGAIASSSDPVRISGFLTIELPKYNSTPVYCNGSGNWFIY